MSGPFHLLKHDHRIIENGLRALGGVCIRLQGGEPIPHATLMRLVEFIRSFADAYHHGKEESILFPVLVRAGIQREGGPLGAMEREHQIERRLMGSLDKAIDEYREGDAEAVSRFVEAARAYTHMMVGHLEREDSVLFPIADALLSENEKTELTDAFRKAEQAYGTDRIDQLERSAIQLESDWAL